MELRKLTDKDKQNYDRLVTHVIQSWEWGQFRQSLGLPLLRYGLFKNGEMVQAFALTLHQIPLTNFLVGYLPKGPFPDQEHLAALKQIAREYNLVFIKIEPHVEAGKQAVILNNDFKKSPKPLFTKHNFVLDLSKSEEELLATMHQKTRYNIRLATKRGVVVKELTDEKSFNSYLDLYFETTARQGYYGHSRAYHKKAWQVLKSAGMARLLIGFYQNQPLTAWMLLNFKDTLYYPYGGSSTKHREVMASNLVAWEAIKLGKKLKLKYFDLWGALGENPNPKDSFIGFHNFKKGFGGRLVEYVGTYDLVFNRPLYYLFNFIDQLAPLKIFLLKLLGKA